ncbi:hypothetical protein Bca52824_032524 [Brassica carinata]|uniref:Uncharacterized protein n=1 Tax=Brassica carinata TaxID=52824 RepID=A0A8X7SCX0_BRACI|nr:hypothetical protein Bca52824_032524 [Brassica carinata]
MHSRILRGIYASEGWFMKLIESNNNNFVTKDASKAHLFYLPFSSRVLQAPSETRKHFTKSIRALCNSDVVFGKDTSLPETFVRDPKKPLSNIGGKSATQRPTLAFFAGKPVHGYLRPILLSYRGNDKDPDLKIFGKLSRTKGKKNYLQFMKTSKHCICAKGVELGVVRALFVAEKDIPNLKKILMSVSERRYRQMQMRVKRVQKHFLWHAKAEKYDMFHMILHSVWFNRVFQIYV